jgi:DNA-binding IclR family transcriptional regulator
VLSDSEATAIRERGFALASNRGHAGSLAVVVPDDMNSPIAALAVDGPRSELDAGIKVLVPRLNAAASQLASALRGR